MHTHTHIYIPTHTHTLAHITHSHMYTHSHIHTHIHTYTHTHTHVHTHTHIHTHQRLTLASEDQGKEPSGKQGWEKWRRQVKAFRDKAQSDTMGEEQVKRMLGRDMWGPGAQNPPWLKPWPKSAIAFSCLGIHICKMVLFLSSISVPGSGSLKLSSGHAEILHTQESSGVRTRGKGSREILTYWLALSNFRRSGSSSIPRTAPEPICNSSICLNTSTDPDGPAATATAAVDNEPQDPELHMSPW